MKKLKIRTFIAANWAWISIVVLAAAVRLLTLPKLLIFTPDEAYISYFVASIVKDFHIIWIGVSILGFDFYMGPFWIYALYPFYALLNGDPMVMGVLTSLMGVTTVFLIYWLGREMFNKKVWIIAALLYATSALVIFYDQRPYPPGVPMWLMLMTLSLFMTQKSNKWWIVFAFLAGMVFHIHLSLGLMILVGAYWAYLRRKSLNKKILLISALTFIVTISPLIAFDYFHKGSNVTAPIRVLKLARGGEFNLNFETRLNSLLGGLSRMWYLDHGNANADEILYPCNTRGSNSTTGPVLLLSTLTLVIYASFLFAKKTWRDENRKLLALASLAIVIPFLFLPIFNPVEYYLLGLFPILFLIVGVFVGSLGGRVRGFAIILLIAAALNGVFTAFNANGDYGMLARKRLIARVGQIIGDETFELKTTGGACTGGWRYLFLSYYKKPLRSTEDESFAWLYPDEVSNKQADYTVGVKETRLPASDFEGEYLIQEGGFSAWVKRN